MRIRLRKLPALLLALAMTACLGKDWEVYRTFFVDLTASTLLPRNRPAGELFALTTPPIDQQPLDSLLEAHKLSRQDYQEILLADLRVRAVSSQDCTLWSLRSLEVYLPQEGQDPLLLGRLDSLNVAKQTLSLSRAVGVLPAGQLLAPGQPLLLIVSSRRVHADSLGLEVITSMELKGE